jgi:hypothetical protein
MSALISSTDFKRGEAVLNGFEDALGGGEQGGGLAIALFDEGDLALLEGLEKCGALLRELHGEILEVGERTFEFLDLHAEAVEVFVALGGRLAEIEVARGGLAEELHLRAELRGALAAARLCRRFFSAAFTWLSVAYNRGDAVDDARGLGGIVDAQAVHDFDQQLQFAALGRDGFGELSLPSAALATFSTAARCSAARRRYGSSAVGWRRKLTQRFARSADWAVTAASRFPRCGEIDVADLL